MPWYLLITGLAGGLLLAFALTEWLLDRAEPDREGSRRRPFLAAGATCLACALVLYATWQQQVQAAHAQQLAVAQAVAEPIRLLEGDLGPALGHIEQLLAGPTFVSLGEIQSVRQQLLDARRKLAVATYDPSLGALVGQTDTLLGVAYHTAGAQWSLLKQQRLTVEERKRSVAQLQNEFERWTSLRDCVMQGSTSCAKTKVLTEAQSTLAEFNRWMHLYSVEMLRFSETDHDLVDFSPAERKRLAAVLARARRELSERAMAEWSRPVVLAADQLLQAAETALQQESVLISQGQWGPDWQQRAYRPVQLAMERYFMALSCTGGYNMAPCSKTVSQRPK